MLTVEKKLRIGDALILGRHCPQGCSSGDNGYEIRWLKANKEGEFISEGVLDILSFDAIERHGTTYEQNRNYSLSNLLQYMNASGEGWYSQSHPADSRPPYKDLPGFLSKFEDYELCQMETTSVETEEGRVSSLVRLPSISEIGPGEGQFQLFHKKGVRAHPCAALASTRWDLGLESFVAYWTSEAKILNRTGYIEYVSTGLNAGLRPVIRIKEDAELEMVDKGVYRVKPVSKKVKGAFTNKQLFELLGITK